MISQEEAIEQLRDIQGRLRCWETGVWMRHVEDPTPFARTIDCVMCKGTGKAHFCANPGCEGEANDECLHPNEQELEDYARLMVELSTLKNLVDASAKKYQEAHQERPDPKKLVESLLSALSRQ